MLRIIGWLLLGSGLTVLFGQGALVSGLFLIIFGAMLITKSMNRPVI